MSGRHTVLGPVLAFTLRDIRPITVKTPRFSAPHSDDEDLPKSSPIPAPAPDLQAANRDCLHGRLLVEVIPQRPSKDGRQEGIRPYAWVQPSAAASCSVGSELVKTEAGDRGKIVWYDPSRVYVGLQT
ncbi:hypothetical protein K435DRAFT_812323 [Dendrothele bispora CBS 962.96]|uniref:Uncharacterized protein n=1 Tax=Dendrothele bispora (strain CBS 962.96) TaxID=1314807 RepID=A0A4S8KPF9_DENBC|nr:hypothetical protein K435DRAFT_812323 [Dendrothele bispora CBS 962.96]